MALLLATYLNPGSAGAWENYIYRIDSFDEIVQTVDAAGYSTSQFACDDPSEPGSEDLEYMFRYEAPGIDSHPHLLRFGATSPQVGIAIGAGPLKDYSWEPDLVWVCVSDDRVWWAGGPDNVARYLKVDKIR
jgi:hypothetical protein